MFVRTLLAAAALSLALGASGERHAVAADACSLGGKYFVRGVQPFSAEEHSGYTDYREFRGADLFVPAQPGLTQEWLQRVLSYQIAAGECDFGAPDAKVTVLSSGGGFAVQISGKSEKDAGVILRHAQQLVR